MSYFKNTCRTLCLCLALSSGIAPACGGDEETTDEEGLRMCCELGALCHPGPDDPATGAKQTCHSLGHENDPAQCRAEYDECMELCAGEGEGDEHSCL